MKTNGTRRILTFMLALVLVFTTVCVGTTEVEAAEKFTTIIAPTQDRKSTRLNSSHSAKSRMPSSA